MLYSYFNSYPMHPPMHSYSIRTEYSDEDPKELLRRAPSFATDHRLSNQDLYTHKLEALSREHAKNIKANKPIIEKLQGQRRFFKRICEMQKEKLQRVDMDLLREEYEQEVVSLREKRNRMHQMVSRLHEDAEGRTVIFQEIAKCLSENQVFLEASLHELEVENAKYTDILQQKRDIVRLQEERLTMNAEAIVEKERIEDKYKLIREEIAMREGRGYHK